MESNQYSAHFRAALLRAFPDFGDLFVPGPEPGCFPLEFLDSSGSVLHILTKSIYRAPCDSPTSRLTSADGSIRWTTWTPPTPSIASGDSRVHKPAIRNAPHPNRRKHDRSNPAE